MRRVHLEAAEDHVHRLAHAGDPLGAVKELVWNALDADATRVEVVLHRSPLGGVEAVTVSDDGTGMAPETMPAAFERIGGSWKKWTAGTLLRQRVLHGSNGQGRLRGFALGRRIRWNTVADGTGGRFRTEVSADATTPTDFDIGDSTPTAEPTGTVFTAWGGPSPRLDRLERRDSLTRLTTALAPYLTAYPDVRVVFDGRPVDPTTSIRHTAEYPLRFTTGGGHQEARLRIIEWSTRVARELHLCDANGVPVGATDAGVRAPGFDFTAYVLWRSMADNLGEIQLGEIHDPEVTGLVAVARETLRAHFRGRADDRRRELVARWRADGRYPYEGTPATAAERLERVTFDLVATTVHRHVTRRGGRGTLALLRELVRARPEGLPAVLGEIFPLSVDDRAQLDQALPALARVTRAAGRLTERLAALDRLASADPAATFADHPWVFGEAFGALARDSDLEAVLDRHRGPLGDGETLFARAGRDHDRARHLVVELVPAAGPKELARVTAYADAAAADPRFRGTRTDWDVWLVGAELDGAVRAEARGGRVADYRDGPARVRVWARTRDELLEECAERVRHARERLERDPDLRAALAHLDDGTTG